MAGQTSIIINWRTDIACDSKVKYGLTKTNLSQTVTNVNTVSHHTISLNGLNTNTKYFYTVSNSANSFLCDTFYFFTAPPNNSKQKIRIVATGDCGTGQPTQINTRNALMNFFKNNYINCWLLLGDNAYTNGLDNEYTSLFFAPYQNNFIMHNTCLYPCIGNHDYANTPALAENKAVPYYDLFNLPTTGQLGGVPSNTEAYYSYNYANVHFVSIDSYGTELSLRAYDTLSPQYLWLKQDLQQNNLMWTIVYFHHPPYTMGSHTSDLEGELVSIRTYLTPLFEKNKVDLVLNGHSHNYERSWLIKGHTGYEASFSKLIHAKDTSSARYDGSNNSCPYIKDTITNKGVVYTVCGSSGWATFTQPSYPHDAMYYSNTLQGMAAYIEIEANRLNAFCIGEDSLVHDKFTIFKNIKKNKTMWCQSGQTYTLSASWNGNYVWGHNALKTKQNIFTVGTNTVLYVRDSLNCFADTFKLSIGTAVNQVKKTEAKFFPNPVSENIINIEFEHPLKINSIVIINMSGKQYKIEKYETENNEVKLFIPDLANGEYILKINSSSGTLSRKIILNQSAH